MHCMVGLYCYYFITFIAFQDHQETHDGKISRHLAIAYKSFIAIQDIKRQIAYLEIISLADIG